MKGLLRRLRGILGTGLTWAVGWGAAFGILNVALTALKGVPFIQFGTAVLEGEWDRSILNGGTSSEHG